MERSKLATSLRDVAAIGAIAFILLEITVRVYFAVTLGSDVLWFGTAYCCGASTGIQKDAAKRNDPRKQANTNDPTPRNIQSGYFKYLPHQRRKDFDEHGELFDVTINSHGFRGKDYQIEKGEGVIRVVTLGASSTFGRYDRDHHTYPFFLEEKLRLALVNNGGCRGYHKVEVINLGIPHLVSDNIVSLYWEEARFLDPDVVTFYEGINDAAANSSDLIWGNRPLYYRAVFKLRQWLIVFALLDEYLGSVDAEFSAEEVRDYIDERPSRFVDNVRKIRDLCASQGALFIAITQQAQSSRYSDEARRGMTYQQEVDEFLNELKAGRDIGRMPLFLVTHAKIMEALRELSSSELVPLVDGIAALDHRRDLLASWVHLRAHGNELLAIVIAEKILQLRCGFPAGSR